MNLLKGKPFARRYTPSVTWEGHRDPISGVIRWKAQGYPVYFQRYTTNTWCLYQSYSKRAESFVCENLKQGMERFERSLRTRRPR